MNYGLGFLAFVWTILLVTSPQSPRRAAILSATKRFLAPFIQCTITLAALQWFSTLAT
jgi:hypothetical protein